MKEALVNLLKPLAEVLHDGVRAMPLWAAKLLFLGLLLILMIWVWTLKSEAPSSSRSMVDRLRKDLRLWAIGILLFQVIIYAVLG